MAIRDRWDFFDHEWGAASQLEIFIVGLVPLAIGFEFERAAFVTRRQS